MSFACGSAHSAAVSLATHRLYAWGWGEALGFCQFVCVWVCRVRVRHVCVCVNVSCVCVRGVCVVSVSLVLLLAAIHLHHNGLSVILQRHMVNLEVI